MGGKTLQVDSGGHTAAGRGGSDPSSLEATLTQSWPLLNPSWFLLTHTHVAAAGRTVSAWLPTTSWSQRSVTGPWDVRTKKNIKIVLPRP